MRERGGERRDPVTRRRRTQPQRVAPDRDRAGVVASGTLRTSTARPTGELGRAPCSLLLLLAVHEPVCRPMQAADML